MTSDFIVPRLRRVGEVVIEPAVEQEPAVPPLRRINAETPPPLRRAAPATLEAEVPSVVPQRIVAETLQETIVQESPPALSRVDIPHLREPATLVDIPALTALKEPTVVYLVLAYSWDTEETSLLDVISQKEYLEKEGVVTDYSSPVLDGYAQKHLDSMVSNQVANMAEYMGSGHYEYAVVNTTLQVGRKGVVEAATMSSSSYPLPSEVQAYRSSNPSVSQESAEEALYGCNRRMFSWVILRVKEGDSPYLNLSGIFSELD